MTNLRKNPQKKKKKSPASLQKLRCRLRPLRKEWRRRSSEASDVNAEFCAEFHAVHKRIKEISRQQGQLNKVRLQAKETARFRENPFNYGRGVVIVVIKPKNITKQDFDAEQATKYSRLCTLTGRVISHIPNAQTWTTSRLQCVSAIAWVFDSRKFITITDVSLQGMHLACAPIVSLCSQDGFIDERYTNYLIPWVKSSFQAFFSLNSPIFLPSLANLQKRKFVERKTQKCRALACLAIVITDTFCAEPNVLIFQFPLL